MDICIDTIRISTNRSRFYDNVDSIWVNAGACGVWLIMDYLLSMIYVLCLCVYVEEIDSSIPVNAGRDVICNHSYKR